MLQPAVRTRRVTESKEDATFHGTLRSFTNISSAKSIIKKIGAEVVQLLLAHGFQVLNSASCCIVLVLYEAKTLVLLPAGPDGSVEQVLSAQSVSRFKLRQLFDGDMQGNDLCFQQFKKN